MLPSKADRATGSRNRRSNVSERRDTRSRNAKGIIRTKPRGPTRKAATPASSVEARLKWAARESFNLHGGED